jgi:hypothetical protein
MGQHDSALGRVEGTQQAGGDNDAAAALGGGEGVAWSVSTTTSELAWGRCRQLRCTANTARQRRTTSRVAWAASRDSSNVAPMAAESMIADSEVPDDGYHSN